ncbi:MAG: MobA/MobL family protein [Proteobacteria bacterium]|nr:MobA/MobL family protein [Pseudomonadota bacterium]
MAIYSFNHDSFGRSNKTAGAAAQNAAYNARESETKIEQAFLSAADNAAYNAREEATFAVRSHIIPPGPDEAEAWFREQEQSERKNARMSDRFIGALPRELTPEQCIAVVEAFCRSVTLDRVPWHFALHLELDKKHLPDWNPHAHIIIRDRDVTSGKRFLFTSAGPKERRQLEAKGIPYWSTERLREHWGRQLNLALERSGHMERVDHRSLEEQGIDRVPQIHIGPGARKASEKGHVLESKDRFIKGRPTPYSLIDRGTRLAYNERLIESRVRREQGGDSKRHGNHRTSPHATREFAAHRERCAASWQLLKAEQAKDREALATLHTSLVAKHRAGVRAQNKMLREDAFAAMKQHAAPQWKTVRAIRDTNQRAAATFALKTELKQTYGIIKEMKLATAKPQQQIAWRRLAHQQIAARNALRVTHRAEALALAKVQTATRLALAEKHRGEALQQQADRLTARFANGQGMANQQAAAVAEMALKKSCQQPAPFALLTNQKSDAPSAARVAAPPQQARTGIADRSTANGEPGSSETRTASTELASPTTMPWSGAAKQPFAEAAAQVTQRGTVAPPSHEQPMAPRDPRAAADHYRGVAAQAQLEKDRLRAVLTVEREQNRWQAAALAATPKRSKPGRAADAMGRTTIAARAWLARAKLRYIARNAKPAATNELTGRSSRGQPTARAAARRAEQQRSTKEQAARQGQRLSAADTLNLGADARAAISGAKTSRPKTDRELLREIIQAERARGRGSGRGRGR